ncbi:MAG TPA: PASTA domain-containing protein [Pyrinomonadaceae bacterium]
MSFGRRTLSALGKIGIVIAVIVVFLFGLVGTVYLSLRTAEVKVPDVTGKNRLEAEKVLEDVGLKIRVRGMKPTADKPDTVLNQVPEPGMTVKEGIQVAVEVSRAPKEGETVAASLDDSQNQNANKPAENANENQNQAANENQNQSQNQNQNKSKNKNKNKNSNNTNKNANNSNNANSNRNANGNNMNANRGGVNLNRNANTAPNTNRATTNTNANKRAPTTTLTPNPGTNKRTP